MAIFDVIKYEGNGSTLVYKFPGEDFNTKSRLIVQQAQEALFFSMGAMADRFDIPGTYELETSNIPIISKLVNLPFGRVSPFHAVVYFVDKTERMNVKWGAGKIPFIEPEYNLPMEIGVSGELSFKIGDSITFISKILGTTSQIDDSQTMAFLDKFVRHCVVNYLSNYLNNTMFNLFNIEKKISDISNMLKNAISAEFLAYGLELTQFLIINFAKYEENESYKRYYALYTKNVAKAEIKMGNELAIDQKQGEIHLQQMQAIANAQIQQIQADADARQIETIAKAEAERRKYEEITSIQEHAFTVAEKTAENEGGGNFASAGMGIGIGVGTAGAAANAIGSMYHDALSPVIPSSAQESKEPTVPGNIWGGIGLDDIGSQALSTPVKSNAQPKSKKDRLLELKELFDLGIISQEEFEAKKAEIISEI